MIDLKPYGAFIEYTIRPLLAECDNLIKQLKDYGIRLNNEEVDHYIGILLNHSFKVAIVETIKQIICLGLICLTAYLVLQS